MKFAKHLQDEVVPEWRKAYINYKHGKKLLKAIETTIDELEAKSIGQQAVAEELGHQIRVEQLQEEQTDEDQDAGPSVRLTIDPARANSLGSASGSLLTTEPESLPTAFPERPAPVYTPDSPTGTTPIISSGRGHGPNYSAIEIPPLSRRRTSGADEEDEEDEEDEDEDDVRSDHASTIHIQDLQQQHDDRFRDSSRRPTLSPISKSGSKGSRASPVSAAPPGRRQSIIEQFSHSALSQGSHLMKTLTRTFTMAHSPSRNSSIQPRVIHVEGNSIDSVMDQLLDEEKVFFKFLDEQLQMVNNFYRERELEAATKLKIIKQQLYVANEWKRRHDEKMAKTEARRNWYQSEWSKMRSGLGNIMADTAITEDVTLGHVHRSHTAPATESTSSQISHASSRDPIRNQAVSALSLGGDSAVNGLRKRDHLGRIDGEDMAEGHPATSTKAITKSGNTQSLNPQEHHEQMILEDAEIRRQHLNHKVARSRIKAALYEFYRSLEMLKNYKVLNITGFTKILKKFDKTAGWKASKAYEVAKLRPSYFMSSSIVSDLITETEDLFINQFENGHRRRGMAKLRIPDSKNQSHHSAVARSGIYLGLAIVLFIQAVQSAFSKDTQEALPYWNSLLLIYAGLFLTTLFTCLFGINMYAWSKNRINYKFIFEFDPRDNLDYHEFIELPLFFMLLLCLAMYLDFGSIQTRNFISEYYPLIFMGAVLVILFLPLPIANWAARKWFIQSFGRIMASGFLRVEFRDFFLGDEMNSLVYSMEQFEFAICAYSHSWTDLGNVCNTSHLWVTPFFTALPAWFRFVQCLRRYHDTFEWYPHLLNAGKYFMTLVQLIIYFSFRHYGYQHFRIAYILISLLTSSYTFSWDVYMDWGLLRFGKHGGGAYGHPFLRAELVYERKWVYYLAIIFDFVGRFAWIVRVINLSWNPSILSFTVGFVEVLRRWMWNFFRLENEHLNNVGMFRAIKDIPLPYHIRIEGECDSEEQESEEEEQAGVDQGAMKDPATTTTATAEEGDDHKAAPESTSASRRHTSRQQSGLGRMSSASGSVSYASVQSPGEDTGLRRRGSRSSSYYLRPGSTGFATPPMLPHSRTFVDDAMVEAGFGEHQREHLVGADLSSNKFYDRRDFDSKIMDVPEIVTRMKPKSRSPTTGPDSSSLAGLGMEYPDLTGEASSPASPLSAVPKRNQTIGERIKSGFFGRLRDDSDDEEDDDED
ncbi:hypothetical protein BGZ83_000059 [Gryganskiella cystojenkinii]|nr:hypothetical protein BGZ83_000059 [Gryganskiella cystojenkinii]